MIDRFFSSTADAPGRRRPRSFRSAAAIRLACPIVTCRLEGANTMPTKSAPNAAAAARVFRLGNPADLDQRHGSDPSGFRPMYRMCEIPNQVSTARSPAR